MDITFKDKKVIVFDLDGTLVNLTADWITLKEILIEKYKKIYDNNCEFKRISKCLDRIVEKNDEEVLENFFEVIRQYELENIQNTEVIGESIFFINNKELFGVEKEAQFAILSLNTRSSIIRALKIAEIYNKIAFIVGREDVRRWKPASDGLLKIQKYFKIKKKEMIYFGDLKSDILTGRNAGVETFLIDDLIKKINKKSVKFK